MVALANYLFIFNKDKFWDLHSCIMIKAYDLSLLNDLRIEHGALLTDISVNVYKLTENLDLTNCRAWFGHVENLPSKFPWIILLITSHLVYQPIFQRKRRNYWNLTEFMLILLKPIENFCLIHLLILSVIIIALSVLSFDEKSPLVPLQWNLKLMFEGCMFFFYFQTIAE